VKTIAELVEKLEQHRENLRLWRNGYLAPTEPDPDEREAVMRELRTAISTIEWVLGLEEARKCDRCDGDGKAHGSDRPFEWSGPWTYPGPCPKCHGTGKMSLFAGLA